MVVAERETEREKLNERKKKKKKMVKRHSYNAMEGLWQKKPCQKGGAAHVT